MWRLFSSPEFAGGVAVNSLATHGARLIPDPDNGVLRIRFPFSDLHSRSIFADTFPQQSISLHAPRLRQPDFLIRMLYQLSNKTLRLFKYGDHRLRYIFDQVSQNALASILALDTPTIRSFWEALVELAYRADDEEVFRFLIFTGAKHPGWKVFGNVRYIWWAVLLESHNVLGRIVRAASPIGALDITSPYTLTYELFKPGRAERFVKGMKAFGINPSERTATTTYLQLLRDGLAGNTRPESFAECAAFLLERGANLFSQGDFVRLHGVFCELKRGTNYPGLSPLLELTSVTDPTLYEFMKAHFYWPTITGAMCQGDWLRAVRGHEIELKLAGAVDEQNDLYYDLWEAAGEAII